MRVKGTNDRSFDLRFTPSGASLSTHPQPRPLRRRILRRAWYSRMLSVVARSCRPSLQNICRKLCVTPLLTSKREVSRNASPPHQLGNLNLPEARDPRDQKPDMSWLSNYNDQESKGSPEEIWASREAAVATLNPPQGTYAGTPNCILDASHNVIVLKKVAA